MTIVVDPDRIEDAADEFAIAVAPAVDTALSVLSDALAGSSSMAGDDVAGNTWSAAYDDAAQTVMGVGTDITNGSYKLAGLLEMTWGNHARAEADSHAGGARSSGYPRTLNYADNEVSSYEIPLSRGGFVGEPVGWKLIRSVVGFTWPGGHQDTLRTVGRAWGAAATSLRSASTLVPPAVSALQEQKSPEIANAVTVTEAMEDHINDLAAACSGLHQACTDYATFLDKAHHDAGHELQSLITWTVGIETGGAILGFASLGLAELGAQGAEAGRIGITAARVAGIIRDLIAAAKGVCATIGQAVARVIQVSRKLKVLLGARLSRATTAAVSRLPDEAKTAEELAESRLLEAKPNNRGLDASQLSQTRTVAAYSAKYAKSGRLTRPYINSSLTMQEIMDSVEPIPDPGGVVGGLKWIVPGTWRGSHGVWELVVDPKTKTVLHFLFDED
jgi:hypothetical protein